MTTQKYSCSICDKTFSTHYKLNAHKAIHSQKFHNKMREVGHQYRIKALQISLSKQKEYEQKPKICPNCNGAIPFEKRNNKFCSRSCSISNTNIKRGARSQETKNKISKTNKNKIPHNKNKKIKSLISFCKVCGKTIPNKHRASCSNKCLKIILSKNGGYKPNSVKGIGKYMLDSLNKKVYLQSSYEILCAEILNELNIEWQRPSYIPYISDKPRKYYPDFYLPKQNIYLDPKNNYLISIDITKIKLVQEQNNIKILILSKDKITKKYLSSLI